jgi:transposase InsO family protein
MTPCLLTRHNLGLGRRARLDVPDRDIDCCTREIVGWSLDLRCRADEAITVVERAVAVHASEPGQLTLGSDNGSAFTARRFIGCS